MHLTLCLTHDCDMACAYCYAVREARERLGDREIVITLTTNGLGLTEDRMAWLGENDFYLGLSIDGNRAMHDTCRKLRGGASSFGRVVDGLRHALARPERMETIMVLDPMDSSGVNPLGAFRG